MGSIWYHKASERVDGAQLWHVEPDWLTRPQHRAQPGCAGYLSRPMNGGRHKAIQQEQGRTMGTQDHEQRINNFASSHGAQGVFYGSVNFTQYYQEQTARKLRDTIIPFQGYIPRPEEETTLTTLLRQTNGPEPVVLSGMSGTGKTWLVTQVISNLQLEDPRAFPGGILWESLAELEPQHLLHQWLALLDTRPSITAVHSPRNRFWEVVAQRTSDQGRLLVVVDDVHDVQQLAALLPNRNQALPNCCILLIALQKPYELASSHQQRHCELRGLEAQQVEQLFAQYLGLKKNELTAYQDHFAEIAQRLGSLPLLLVAAAHDMAQGKIFPGAYVASLREQDNPGSWMGRVVMDGLHVALRDLTEPQRNLFTFIGVLGKGSWRRDMLAAVAIRHPAAIQPDLEVLVQRGLVQARADGRYQVNAVVHEFAQQLLEKQPLYVRHSAHICLAHECLNYARRLSLFLMERPDIRTRAASSVPYENEGFVHAYHNYITLETSHIQQVLQWAIQAQDWHLLLQFADVAESELLRYLAANTLAEIRMSFALATIVEPVIRKEVQTRQQPFQAIVCASGWHYIPRHNDAAQPEQTTPNRKAELGLNIQSGRIIDGFFADTCFMDMRWVGVRAAGLLCDDVEFVGCALLACDLSQSVWVNVDARQLTLAGSILSHALFHEVRLHRADLHDADLTGAVLEKVDLRGANLRNCNLTGALFDRVDLRGADLRGARVEGAIFRGVRFQDCRADGVNWPMAFRLDAVSVEASADEHAAIMQSLGPQALPPASNPESGHPRIYAQHKLRSIIASRKENPQNPPRDLDFTGADLRATTCTDLRVSDCLFSKSDFRATRLTDADFSRASLPGADFRGAHLIRPIFQRANLRGADLRTAILTDANLEEADLTDARLRFAIIQQGRLKEARLRGAQLRHASLVGAQLQHAELSEVDLSEANLEDTHLEATTLFKATLRAARLVKAHMHGADMTGADCDGADFTGAELPDEILACAASWRGATLPNGKPVLLIEHETTLQQALARQSPLRLAYLTGTCNNLHLDGYDLLGAQLTGDFVSMHFSAATLDYGRLSGAFSQVDFKTASLRAASLSGIFTASQFDRAILTQARLTGIFAHCSFVGADLQAATFELASLVSCDLSGTQPDDRLLRQAFRLRGCILPDGTRYDGRFNLAGDCQDAALYGYVLADPEQRSAFYSNDMLKRRRT